MWTKIAPRTAILATVLGLSLTTLSMPASASEWWGGVSFGTPAPVAVETQGRWVPEHNEKRDQQVLVAPAHCEKQYVQPVFETRIEYGRRIQVQVSPGYYRDVTVPARYETRCVDVLVPGFWDHAGVPAVTFSGRADFHHDDFRHEVRHVDYRDDHRDNRDDRRDHR